jgi:hypothetical protein
LVGSGMAKVECPIRAFELGQAPRVRLASLGMSPKATQATKQTKFGPLGSYG